MKKNRIVLILVVLLCMVGIYFFQNEKYANIVQFNDQQSAISNINSTRELNNLNSGKFKDERVTELSLSRENSMNVPENTKKDLQKLNNNFYRRKGRINDHVKVISIDNQSNVPDHIKEKFKEWSKKMESQGYIEVDDYSVLKVAGEAISIQKMGSEPLEKVLSNLVFDPVVIKDTEFSRADYLGHKSALGLIEDNGFTNADLSDLEYSEERTSKMGEFSRYYKFQDLGFVKLTERFLPNDGQTVITPELMNTDINGNYGYYLVQKNSTGQSLSMLTWTNENRQYIIEVSNNNLAYEVFKQNILNLANSIPL